MLCTHQRHLERGSQVSNVIVAQREDVEMVWPRVQRFDIEETTRTCGIGGKRNRGRPKYDGET